MKQEYSDRIKAMRLARSWSLRELAKKLELSHNTIVKWERNPDGSEGLATRPSRANMLKLAELFNVEPGWLFFGEAKQTSRSQQIAQQIEMLSEEEIDQIEGVIALFIQNKKGNSNGKAKN